MRSNSRNNIGGFILIGLGVLFLVAQIFRFDVWSVFDLSWPLFIVIPGLVFLGIAFTGSRNVSGFAVPGTVITGTGLILWVQDMTNHWESWAYAWTLYPGLVGLALMFMGSRGGNSHQVDTGRRMALGSLIAFAVFFAFFELAIFNNVFGWNWLPLVLIALGAYLLFRDRINPRVAEKPKNATPAYADYPGGPRKPKNGDGNGVRRSEAAVHPDLQRQIDQALAEDVPPTTPR